MIKNFLIICSLVMLTNSCALLYTPQAEPALFLREKDGTAVNGNIGSNGSCLFVNGNVTKPLSDVISVNANAAIGVMRHENSLGNPFTGFKKQKNIGVNIGINTTRFTKWPMQLWLGAQLGSSADAYSSNLIEPGFSRDTQIVNVLGNNIRYEKLYGNFSSFRVGLSHIIVSNYDNNFNKKDKKRFHFDLSGLAYLNFVHYNYKNSLSVPKANNQLLGYHMSANLGRTNWQFSLKADCMLPLFQLANDLRNRPTDVYHPGFSEIPLFVPSVSFTKYLRRKY